MTQLWRWRLKHVETGLLRERKKERTQGIDRYWIWVTSIQRLNPEDSVLSLFDRCPGERRICLYVSNIWRRRAAGVSDRVRSERVRFTLFHMNPTVGRLPVCLMPFTSVTSGKQLLRLLTSAELKGVRGAPSVWQPQSWKRKACCVWWSYLLSILQTKGSSPADASYQQCGLRWAGSVAGVPYHSHTEE